MRLFRSVLFGVAAIIGFAACTDHTITPPAPGDASFSGATASSLETTGQHLVMFNAQRVPANFAATVARAGGSVDAIYDAIGVAVVTGLSDATARSIAGPAAVALRDVRVQWLPKPSTAQLEHIALPADMPIQAHNPAAAAFFPFQWNMQIIQAHDAWNAGFQGSPNVRVAILDTGIDPFHIDLEGLIDAPSSRAFAVSVNPAGPDWGDDHFHGTHVAGTVVTNGIGTSGVAPHVTLIAVKVLNVVGSGTFGDVVGGIMHATDVGAHVINMSLGATFPKNDPNVRGLVAALNRAVNHATRDGALVVSAAGNDAFDLQRSGNLIATPCESGNGMCVSATGPTDLLASYSNFGRSAINVAAPGGDLAVTGDPLTAMVLAPCSSLSVFLPVVAGFSCGVGSYLFAHGTSMAAPHVAGLGALLASQNGGRTNPAQLRTAIEQSTELVTSNQHVGRGRINIARALGVN